MQAERHSLLPTASEMLSEFRQSQIAPRGCCPHQVKTEVRSPLLDGCSRAYEIRQEQCDPMNDERLQTGVPGLDSIVGGGLVGSNLYLVKGVPGTGKTTLGLQFLIEGARRGGEVPLPWLVRD